MKNIHNIEFYTGSKEELLPNFTNDFPYIASRAELDKFIGRYVPWHWHKTVELFYMESGSLEYDTLARYRALCRSEFRKAFDRWLSLLYGAWVGKSSTDMYISCVYDTGY